jgi:DNA-binding transcriptional LysR family regulator
MASTTSGDAAARNPTLVELRAFVAVAEELHFARAALRLGIAPPPLSQTIRRLEDKLGAVLLERTPRSVALTAAGAELLPRARDILARMEEARAALNAGAEAQVGTLMVGIASNGFAELTPAIIEAFRRTHRGVRVLLSDITTRWSPSPLLSGFVDVALVRPPVPGQDDPRVRTEHVLDEPRIALLPARHRLAGAERTSMAALADEPFVAVGPTWPEICDYWAAADARGGERPRWGAEAWSVPEVLQAVAYLGNAITTIPSVLRFFRVPGIVAVPLVGVSPATMAVMVRADDRRRLVADFVATVRAVSGRLTDLVPTARVVPRSGALPARAPARSLSGR